MPKEEDALDELAKQYDLSAGDYVLIEKFLKLRPAERQAVIAYMQDVVSTLNAAPVVVAKNKTTSPAPATSGQERTEPDIAAKVAELERQNQEKDKQLQDLAAKVAAMEEEDAKRGLMDAFSTSRSASVGKFNSAEKAKI